VSPIKPPANGRARAEGFFQAYLALPIVILFWACGYAWKRVGWKNISDIDVDTGRRALDWDKIYAEREKLAARRGFGRVWHTLF
jgi:yeast amino acid transporter